MASQIQMVMYEGFLGDDPVMRFTKEGKPVTGFRMASNRQYNTADGKKVKETIWLKITAWGKMGEIVNQYCEKGSHVIVTGRLKAGATGSPEVYEKQDGSFGASYEIVAEGVRIIKGKERADTEDAGGFEDELPPF